MNGDLFDTLAKTSTLSPSRRSALILLAGAGLGLPAWLARGEAESADRRKSCKEIKDKRKRKACVKKRQKRKLPRTHLPAFSPNCGESICPPGLVCDPRQGCICPGGAKPCNGICIPNATCCVACREGATCENGVCKGPGVLLYPDLRALPPDDLQFDVLDSGTHVLRFSNTIWNSGEGRLELEGDPNPQNVEDRKIYQNLYDEPIGGVQTRHEQIASDIVFHGTHNHYHFADFASYHLLVRNPEDPEGVYRPITQESTKIGFCITDTDEVQVGYAKQYQNCGQELQGLTPGWGDKYDYRLPDQWIVLNDGPLDDGEYGLESTADPKGLLIEADEMNNTAVTYFTVSGGAIGNVRHTPNRGT